MSAGGARVTFVGRWEPGERRVVAGAAASVEEYLGSPLPSRWRFEKAGGRYLVSQPSLLLRRSRAATLGELVGRVREAAEFAAPFEAGGG